MLEWSWPSPFQQAPYGSRHIQWLQQAIGTYVPAGTGQDEPIPSSKMWSLLLLQIWGFEIWCIFLFTGASGDSLHDWACRQIWCKLRRSLGLCGASASDNATRGRQGPCHESDDSRPRQRSKERWHWLSAERDFCAGVVGWDLYVADHVLKPLFGRVNQCA